VLGKVLGKEGREELEGGEQEVGFMRKEGLLRGVIDIEVKVEVVQVTIYNN
jgi:hypothetical protein